MGPVFLPALLAISFVLVVCRADVNSARFERDETTVLSRRKRYLVFPEGASLSLAVCMTVQTPIKTQIWTEAINWGISYELPTNASEFRHFFPRRQAMQRRHRRDLYQKMEVIMNSMGFDGRTCIYRALCEASRTLTAKGNSIIEGILRIMFRFPLKQLLTSEPEEHRLYHRAYRRGLDSEDECVEMFPGCHFSLIDMTLGAYSSLVEDVPDDDLNND